MQNKRTTFLLSIISILTVILTLVGLTFAFFANSMSGNNAAISILAEENLGNIQFEGGSDFVAGSNIEPGWSESRTVTLTIPAARAQEIYIKLDYTNNMPELQYKFVLTNIMVGSTNSGTSSAYVTNDFSDNGASITSTGTDFITLDSSNTEQSVTLTQVNTTAYAGTITLTYTFTMKLPETNVPQNQNQGKLFTGKLYAELDNEIMYYNSSNPNGTTVIPVEPEEPIELEPDHLFIEFLDENDDIIETSELGEVSVTWSIYDENDNVLDSGEEFSWDNGDNYSIDIQLDYKDEAYGCEIELTNIYGEYSYSYSGPLSELDLEHISTDITANDYFIRLHQEDLESETPIVQVALVDKILEDNSTRLTRSSFNSVLTTSNTNTLYTTTNTEDGTTVYYFAGNAQNNWVKFGKCTSSSYNCTVGQDLYWRIIRTNETIEDGGVRLLYAGSGSVAATNAYIGTAGYYTSNNNPMYAGYMWGTTGSLANNRTNQTVHSNTPADKINTWYTATFNNNADSRTKDSENNLLTSYINPSAIYCNDRSLGSGTYSTSSSKTFYFAPYTRNNANKTPSYACGANTQGTGHYFESGQTGNVADKFTGSATNASGVTIGNGLLTTTPAGLMTADEVAFAGGVYSTNSAAWYYYNAASTPGSSTGTNYWWTMSPYRWKSGALNIFSVRGSANPGYLHYSTPNTTNAVRPVISLKASVLWNDGDGIPSNPYTVKLPSE